MTEMTLAAARPHTARELPGRRYRALLRALFWLTLALRLFQVVFLHSPRDFVYSDMASYHAVAFELLGGAPSPWHAFRPVGYSMLLAVLYVLSDGSRTLVGVVQAVMGAALVPMTGTLARSAGASRGTALLAALGVAGSVPLAFYCGLLLTEIPTSFFMMLGVVLSVVRRPRESRPALSRLALGGLCLGVAGALRPNMLLLGPLLAFCLLLRGLPGGLRAAWRAPLVWTLAFAVPVLLVSAYNSHVLARPAGPAANGGLNFYLNFADVHTVQYRGRLGGYWVSPIPNGARYTRVVLTDVPLFEERHFYAEGLKYVRENPRSLLLALRNLPEAAGIGLQLYWPNWPGYERLFRGYSLGFFGLVLVPALAWLFSLAWPRVRARAPPAARITAAVCCASVVPVYLFLGDPRLRVPFDPLWIVLACLAYQAPWRALRARRRALSPT